MLLQNRTLTALLQAVQFRSSSQVETFIKCIRENEPSQNIFATIQQCLRQFDDTATDSAPPSHEDDDQSGTQLHDRPSNRICPTCHQPSLMGAAASTPPGSVQDSPGLPVAGKQDPQEEAPQNDTSCQLVAQQAQPGISVEGPNPRGSSHKHGTPLYGIQTLVRQEKTPLSDIITGFMDSAKTLISCGASLSGVLGSDTIDVEQFFCDRTQEDGLTVSGWACELWRSFHDWDVYVRLAQILAYTTVMRWMLDPTALSYAAIPDILKPRPIQYMVPHHIALDFLPLPPLREALIKNLRDWMTALPAAALSVNWARGMDEAVIWGESNRRRLLSRDFMEHVTNYQNWSIGESILGAFPEVEGMIRLDRI
ncbi:hypothetical protein AYL99_03315 [Fonsecaea erecta]|uniref:Uncharacterized protein n=1 Tax=Fonsecaea erecta TaxID=1367422 RepID=A0A178ZMS1_9EURO|nr:hypothetical protein AYL99_03315 [Fonsecaea erecta]OAP61114.1 hypothetical protein AYL99_03315 [Fonsecaea erecta]